MKSEFVKYVHENSHVTNTQNKNFVRVNAHKNLTLVGLKLIKQKLVKCVEGNLIGKDIQKLKRVQKVVALSLDTEVDVYDIEVEKDHCYFANGILVSNSHYSDAFCYTCQAINHLETITGRPDALAKHRAAVESRIGRV